MQRPDQEGIAESEDRSRLRTKNRFDDIHREANDDIRR